jgi:polysaccharide deacetylase family sporulation protein PdaB
MYFAVIKKRKLIIAISIMVASIMLSICLMGGGLVNVFSGFKNRELPIYYVKTDKKQVAISFDCAWGVDYTDTLLSVMQEQNVKCTFFTVDFWAEKHSEYVQNIFEHGHEIGTHSATHPHMSKLDKKTIIKELTTSIDAIESITKSKVELFRAPYGEYNDLLINTAKELGLYTIQWDVDSLDWKDLSAEQIKERVVSRVKNGSIVLFHNQGLNTHKALKDIILALKEKGYEFVKISELIYRDNYKMGADGAQILNT